MASAATPIRSRSLVLLLATALSSCNAAAPSPKPIGAGLPAQTYSDFPGCTHPAVNPDCHDGWCTIPAGCFIMGSPESEWSRGAASEDPVAVTLTHSFSIQQYEMTQREWTALGVPNPTRHDGPDVNHPELKGECIDPSCPVGSLNWFEAVAFANRMSERHDPPLESCYRLLGCAGELGSGMTCTGFELTTPSAYDCKGFRLPTEAEWEYAARAGTRTAFYAGDITPQANSDDCFDDPTLDLIAWYCFDAAGSTHQIGKKRPNGWNVFDMPGNAFEWVHDTQTGATPAGPLTNPGGGAGQESGRMLRGGSYALSSSFDRAASGAMELDWNVTIKGWGMGFRLVRTEAP